MLSLAWQTIRARKAGFIAPFVAVFFGSVLITMAGVLLESGLRAGVPPQRYAPAAVVVTAPQAEAVKEDQDVRFAERVPLAANRVADIARVPGVRAAYGDVTVQAAEAQVHGWSSARLAGVTGQAPQAPDEIVMATDARTGDTVTITIGGLAKRFRLVGTTTTPGQAYVTDDRARTLAGRPGQVDTVAVVADPGTDPDDLAERIKAAVPGVATATGLDRAEAEFLEVGAARSFLVLMAGSFGGTMTLIVLLVVASTLGLAVQQRRREFALLRAVAATPRQVYRLIGAESVLVAAIAAVLGAGPGIALSLLLRGVFADLGVVPADFEFTVSPFPVLASLLLSVLAALGAGVLAGRRAARISPVAALGEAAVEPKQLGKVRLTIGWVLVPLGVAAGVGIPLFASGDAATAGAASSALVLVVAVALLGPRLLTVVTSVLGRFGLWRSPSGFLAGANARANARRLASATTPLIMGVAMASVQLFMSTTVSGTAQHQVDTGMRADHVIVGQGGIAPGIVDAVRNTGATAVPVARTQVHVAHTELGDPKIDAFAAQGVTPQGLDKVLDLDVREGDLGHLTGTTVALSTFAAASFGVDVGESLTMTLGDGTPYTAKVVALYRNGLGFGDVTLPHDVVINHTTSRLDSEILVSGGDPTTALAPYPGLSVTDRGTRVKAPADGFTSVNLLVNLIVLGFIAIAVVNILVLATAARVREFALLRLVGAKPRQVRSMVRGEMTIVVVAAVVLGSLAALPPLLGVSLSLTGSPLPTVPPLVYLAIVAVTLVLGWASMALPARTALRPSAVAAIGVRE